jgi:hypothetical protein
MIRFRKQRYISKVYSSSLTAQICDGQEDELDEFDADYLEGESDFDW